jgi:signal transduction histidine kinase
MIDFILITALLIVSWQLVKITKVNQRKQQQLFIVQQTLQHCLDGFETASSKEPSQIAYQLCSTLGQSIAALQIQLQVAHKLWQINPFQAKHALLEAYELSSTLMQEIRQTVRTLKQTLPPDASTKACSSTQYPTRE